MEILSSHAKGHNVSDGNGIEPIDVEAVKKYLRTRYSDVFELNQDGLTYKKPASLFGTPVQKVQEGSAYWKQAWHSLDCYLAQESEEERLKSESRARLDREPINKRLKEEAKRHQDNVSKHRKIREIFGGQQPCHPNQVVSKRYLPDYGLCEQETMYHLGCKISDFHVLANKGLMDMDPWDFVRWRIGEVLLQRRNLGLPGSASEVKRIIHSIGAKGSDDPLFRQAVLYSAKLQGRPNAYGPKRKQGTYMANGKSQTNPPRTRGGTGGAAVRSHSAKLASQLSEALVREREEARRERRARLAQQSFGGYQGVNAYRQQKNTAQQQGLGGAPCAG